MKFINIEIKTNSYGADNLAGTMLLGGISSFSVSDPQDFLDIVNEKTVPFDYFDPELLETVEVTVNVYLAMNSQGKQQKEFIEKEIENLKNCGFDCGSLTVEYTETDDGDWADGWKQYFHPFDIGDKFIIKPSWEDCVPNGRHILEIDPESSFGTGQHETTKLCLELLEEVVKPEAKVLDMGCGSGILAIGALKLGAKSAAAVDIEEAAVSVTFKNAIANGVADRLEAFCGNTLTDSTFKTKIFFEKYDIITANIVADILIEMLDDFIGSLNDGGTLILSGIINTKKEAVESALKTRGLTYRTVFENDWVAVEVKENGTNP